MSDSLLSLFRIGLLVLLYLFFARVLWAVWSEVRTAQSAPRATTAAPPPTPVSPVAPTAGGRRKQVTKLVVMQPRHRKGITFATDRELTFGRGAGCSVTLTDDSFVSTVHARLYQTAEHLMLEDLGSTNGTYLNGHRLTAAQPVRKGDRIQIGGTVLEAD